jgi:hypothetical protein
MALYWAHIRDYILNLGRLSALPKHTRSTSFKSALKPLHASSLNISWHESYEETAIGYEAGWTGVFQNPVK